MLRLWPLSGTSDVPSTELTDEHLADTYAYPSELDRPYVRVNFVSSADGAASAGGLSGGLSGGLGTPADRRVFGLLRELCEVVLVGAGTARAENYRGARRPSRVTGVAPRIAVVTGRADLDPASPLFTDTSVPPLVITGSGGAVNRERLRAAGAEVVVLDEDRVGAAGLLAALDARGLHRVLCEGGPGLFGDLIAADAVDELCLTVSPVLVGGDTFRIAHGAPGELRPMRLAAALTERDSLLLRYIRDR